MNPRTKYQKQVFELNTKLRPASQSFYKWCVKNHAPHQAFRLKSGRICCMDCGREWIETTDKNNAVCPHCGTLLQIVDTKHRTFSSASYVSYFDVIENIQLQRIFRLETSLMKGKVANHEINEVARIYINEKGAIEICARSRQALSHYMDSFCLDSDIELKSNWNNHVYKWLSYSYVYPFGKILPYYRKRGVTIKALTHSSLYDLLSGLHFDGRIETILKMENYNHADYFSCHISKLKSCWNSYKVAMRHNYHIDDVEKWCRYINTLTELGLDTHNPHYVCPKDFNKSYTLVEKRFVLKKELEDRRLKLAQLEADETEYASSKSKYFDIVISDDDIRINVLDSVKAHYEEGVAMHHCVFDNKYYRKPESLILSAKDKDGNRLETIELSLIDFRVSQSRGVCNKNTNYHERIIDVVNRNSFMFQSASVS